MHTFIKLFIIFLFLQLAFFLHCGERVNPFEPETIEFPDTELKVKSYDPNQLPLLEKEVFEIINSHRVSLGLPECNWSITIAKQCRTHSQNMAFGYIDFGHQGLQERLSTIKNTFRFIAKSGEVIYRQLITEDVASNVVQNWLNDSNSRQKILGDFNFTGVGIAKSEKGIYVTQIVIKRSELD
jgi:uncharacterized protein YkwD